MNETFCTLYNQIRFNFLSRTCTARAMEQRRDRRSKVTVQIEGDLSHTYLGSVRTMYRLLAVDGQTRERRNQRSHPAYAKPELLATGPNEVWSWDITKLKGPAKWSCYHLYVILDIFSRYVVGWMIAPRESAQLAEH